ncbi:hypothetical protein G6T08_005057 [Salmonella enterica]|nr:hypothetical protein [Salmonella enterica]ELD8112257.1 hypothetical protein [Salmonella enterica subsp. enterica serovar Benin]EEO5753532.1 hypothetical protein [Salmonella enterica]EHT6840821.1 hypothetical protein [Salmonella enterica]EIS3892804.1 hypothetical protein [Salmonella enterica]
MNKVMNEENRRHGGRNTLCRLFRSGRWFLCLALLCSVMLPGFADAASAGNGFCKNLDGGGDVYLKLPPSITIKPGQTDIPPIPSVTVKYKCSVPDNKTHTVSIVSLGDANVLVDSLKSLGLTLNMTITDSSGGKTGHWTFPAPGSNSGIFPENVEIGEPYPERDNKDKDTGERTMTINATLSRDPSKSTTPGFYAIPSLTAFRLEPYYNILNGPALISPAIRLQYVPTCFVTFSLSKSNINFGPVMTTDVDNSFSRTDNFTVTADVNYDCNSGQFGNLLTGYKPNLPGHTDMYYLYLPLKVSFIPQGDSASDISDGGKSLLLRNDDQKINGLKLQIFNKNTPNTPVTFGDYSTPGVPPPSEANKLGEFSGNRFNANQQYTVDLSATGGTVVTGSYNAKVLVKVNYY